METRQIDKIPFSTDPETIHQTKTEKKFESMSLAELHKLIHEKTTGDIASELNLTARMLGSRFGKFGTSYSELKKIKIEDAKAILGENYNQQISNDLIKTLLKKAIIPPRLSEIPFCNLHKAILDSKKFIDTANLFHIKENHLVNYLKKFSITWSELKRISIDDAKKILKESYDLPFSAMSAKKLVDGTQIDDESNNPSLMKFAKIHLTILSSDHIEDAENTLGLKKEQLRNFLHKRMLSFSILKNLDEKTARNTLNNDYKKPFSEITCIKLNNLVSSNPSLKRKRHASKSKTARNVKRIKKENSESLDNYSIAKIHEAILSTETIKDAEKELKITEKCLSIFLIHRGISYSLLKKIPVKDCKKALGKDYKKPLCAKLGKKIKSIKIIPLKDKQGNYDCIDLKFSHIHKTCFQSKTLSDAANLLTVEKASLQSFLADRKINWKKIHIIPSADLKALFPHYKKPLSIKNLPLLRNAIWQWENQHQNKSEVESLSDDESEVHSLPDDEMEVTCSETDEPEEENDKISGQNEASVSLAKSHFGLFARKNSAPLNKQAEKEIVYHPGK